MRCVQKDGRPVASGTAEALNTGPGVEQHHRTPVVGRSYRVSWRRPHWADTTATKTKTFERAAAAHRYRDQLAATGAHTLLECRPVGAWTPCVGKGCR